MHLGILLAATDEIVIAPGIANLRGRVPAAMFAGAATIAEAYPGRYLLGLGGATRAEAMRQYLDGMDEAAGSPLAPRFVPGPSRASTLELMRQFLEGTLEPSVRPPAVRFPRVPAALGPKMLQLARERADGAHPLASPVQHTRLAREALGPDKLLVPEQAVVFDRDPARAHAHARECVATNRRAWPDSPYNANLRRLGYGDADLSGDGSDRLVDDLVAWGDETA